MVGRRKNRSYFILLWGVLVFSSVGKVSAAQYVAGVEPDRRRTDIPIITEASRDAAWQARALTGISKPYPEHVLQFLDDQGSWFSPFLYPGMIDRYDIRGWHTSPKK